MRCSCRRGRHRRWCRSWLVGYRVVRSSRSQAWHKYHCSRTPWDGACSRAHSGHSRGTHSSTLQRTWEHSTPDPSPWIHYACVLRSALKCAGEFEPGAPFNPRVRGSIPRRPTIARPARPGWSPEEAGTTHRRLAWHAESGEVLYSGRPSRCVGPDGAHARWDVLEFLARVVDHIPGPSQQTVRYWGFYANAARGKRRKAATTASQAPRRQEDDEFTRRSRLSWAKLIRRLHEVDPLPCPF